MERGCVLSMLTITKHDAKSLTCRVRICNLIAIGEGTCKTEYTMHKNLFLENIEKRRVICHETRYYRQKNHS